MRNFSLVFKPLLFSALCLLTASVQAEPIASSPITIALQTQSNPQMEAFVQHSLRDIALTLEDRAILIQHHATPELSDPSVFSQVQFVIVSAPLFALLERYGGFSAIASIRPLQAYNAESASSTAVLVKKSADGNIRTLKSLSGSKIGILKSEALETEMQLNNELKLQQQNPFDFFKTIEKKSSTEGLLAELKNGLVDAAAIPSSSLRDLSKSVLGTLQVVEPRLNLELNLPHTTSVYPGWVFAASLQTSKTMAEDIGALLRSLPARNDFRWAPAADYRTIHQVLRDINDPTYKSLQRRSFKELVIDYASWILLVFVVVIGLILHGLRAERLVQKRTSELQALHQEQQAALTRYEQLEKASIVGQMSNLVAHELRQPLAAITNYVMGARRRLNNGLLDKDSLLFALQRTLQESRRANEIVEHVQGYAKQKRRVCQKIDLTTFLGAIASQYNDSTGQPRIRLNLEVGLSVDADPLEIELCVKNLIKNAFEAGLAARQPVIVLSTRHESENMVRIEVTDNGYPLSDEAFEALAVPFNSAKPDGLGLGLAIVRKITESYAGHLEFKRMKPQGLTVSMVIPSTNNSASEKHE